MNISSEGKKLTLLSIGGSDPTGAAGILADMRTFQQLDTKGVAIITAVTSQNSNKLIEIVPMSPRTINFQASSILSEYAIHGIKLGMLVNEQIIEAVCDLVSQLPGVPVVLDPVLRSSSGYDLLEPEAIIPLAKELFPLCSVVTPNVYEAEVLSNLSVRSIDSVKEAARAICSRGARAVVIKGGHLPGDEAVDVLYDRYEFRLFEAKRSNTMIKRGKGCIFSSSLAVNLARGFNLPKSVEMSKSFVAQARDDKLFFLYTKNK